MEPALVVHDARDLGEGPGHDVRRLGVQVVERVVEEQAGLLQAPRVEDLANLARDFPDSPPFKPWMLDRYREAAKNFTTTMTADPASPFSRNLARAQLFHGKVPPHAGFAFGMDRLTAILAGEENIREVIAYPKTQSGADPLTNAPARIDEHHLTELGLRILPPTD